MIFHKGPRPKTDFYFNGHKLEIVNNFTYLGVVLTPRLSARKHIQHLVSKCNARIGILFSQLPVKSIPYSVAIKLFDTYVLPIITYALPIWLPQATESQLGSINCVLTKFLKRFLGVPYATHNAIVYFITGNIPLSHRINGFLMSQFLRLRYPNGLDGVRITPPAIRDWQYSAEENLPNHFQLAPVIDINQLPRDPKSRRAFLYEALDLYHPHICIDGAYHRKPDMWCICKFCGEEPSWFHFRECPYLKDYSPCARLRFLENLRNGEH